MPDTQPFKLKRNDTRPLLLLKFSAGSTDVITSVQFHMVNEDTGNIVVNAACTNITQPSDTSGGTAMYKWNSADTSVAGTNFKGEAQVTFSDGRIETYPNDGNIPIIITEDLA